MLMLHVNENVNVLQSFFNLSSKRTKKKEKPKDVESSFESTCLRIKSTLTYYRSVGRLCKYIDRKTKTVQKDSLFYALSKGCFALWNVF